MPNAQLYSLMILHVVSMFMCHMMIDDQMNLLSRKNKKKRKEKKKMGENFCLKIDYFRIDENDFETDLWKIIETYPKLCLFFRGGGGVPAPHLLFALEFA